MSVLCATYRVYLRDRTTGNQIEGCDLSTSNIEEANWTRTLNATSTAYIKYPLPALGCCECSPQAWQHELVIERTDDTTDSDRIVWAGVVTQTIEDRALQNTMEIFASDRSIWWSRQPYATEDITFPAGTDEGEVWATLVNRFAEPCVQSGLQIRAVETGCPITEPITFLTGQEWFATLAEMTSVKWSVVADRLLGPAANLQGTQVQHRLASDIDWKDGGPVVDTDGSSTVTHVTVTSAEPGVPGAVTGSWPAGTPQPAGSVGCHVLRVVDPKVTSVAQAVAAARLIYEQRRNGNRAVVTSAGTLSEQTELTVDDLIPDRRVSVETNGTCNDFVDIKLVARVLANFGLDTEGGRTGLRESRVAIDLIDEGGTGSASRLSV